MNELLKRLDTLMKSIMDWCEPLEKGERKIVESPEQKKVKEKKEFEEKRYKAPEPTHYPKAPEPGDESKEGIHAGSLDFLTTKVRMNALGNKEKTRDHATYSEHVILHNGIPLGIASVHHAHPSDLKKPVNKLGHMYDHSVDIHAPEVHSSAHDLIRAKVKQYINSKHFQGEVDKHNEVEHGYFKPKFWLAAGNKPKAVISKPDLAAGEKVKTKKKE